MSAFMKTLLSLSLSGTLVFLLLKLLKPLYREKFSRRWQYYIWLVAALRFLIPFSPDGTLMNRVFTEAEQTVWQGEWQEESEGPQDGDASGTGTAGIAGIAGMARPALTAETQGRESGEPVEARPERISGEKSLRISGMLFEIWLAGAAFLFIWKLVSYQRFVRGLRTGSLQALDADTDMQGILASVQRTMGIKKKVRLSRSERLASPVLLGVMRLRLVLPAHELEPKMLPYLFRHELTHVRRRDNLYKWLVQLVICIHWFNPAAHLLGKEVCRACELACDEAIIASLDAKEKRSYGDMLITFAKAGSVRQKTSATVALSEGGKQLKERLGAIMRFQKGTKAAAAGSVLAMLILLAGAISLGSYLEPAGKPQTGEAPEGSVQAETEQAETEQAGDREAEETWTEAARTGENGTEEAGIEAVSAGQQETRLELVSLREAYPYFEMDFQLIDGQTGEAEIFSPNAPDMPQPELKAALVSGYSSTVGSTEKAHDTVCLGFWSAGGDEAEVTVNGVTCTVPLTTKEPREEVTIGREVSVYGGTAVLETALVYPDAVVLNFSGLSEEAFGHTAFILAKDRTQYGDGEYLSSYRGDNTYDPETGRYQCLFAFPGGMPENRRLMLRVINLMERNSRGDKLAEDYPLEFLYE